MDTLSDLQTDENLHSKVLFRRHYFSAYLLLQLSRLPKPRDVLLEASYFSNEEIAGFSFKYQQDERTGFSNTITRRIIFFT
jgi:hypothetical protein